MCAEQREAFMLTYYNRNLNVSTNCPLEEAPSMKFHEDPLSGFAVATCQHRKMAELLLRSWNSRLREVTLLELSPCPAGGVLIGQHVISVLTAITPHRNLFAFRN
jgi:hypothetical protein